MENQNSVGLEIKNKFPSGREVRLKEELSQYLGIQMDKLEIRTVYCLESPAPLTPEKVDGWAQSIFCDSLLQEVYYRQAPQEERDQASFLVEVSFRPGVTDNPAKAAMDALALLGETQVKVSSGTLYLLYGDCTHGQMERVAREFLANDLIHKIRIFPREGGKRKGVPVPAAASRSGGEDLPETNLVKTISLDQGEDQLVAMSEELGWALSRRELVHVRDYFSRRDVQDQRKKVGLPPFPTDVEMEVLAQSWSEHCKHKIFAAHIDYSEEGEEGEKDLGDFSVQGLFSTYIKGATLKVLKDRKIDWAVSIFSDNAGMVRFDRNLDLCIKVETHNSPSALDPYGGALTGILGVNRDILGCGMGAKPVANTDVFCLCPPHWPLPGDRESLPQGLKHPRRILEGVHAGVADGGNKSGIPTVNGSLVFDESFAGKPLIFCGTLGVIPHRVGPKDSYAKTVGVGDKIVMVGGAVGKDGIHGATLSSLEMTESTPSTMVQIGDPLTQKRMTDFILEARNLNLYTCLTDNGAGGLSSSVGEMSLLTGGAKLDLSLCPLKYEGLLPYEIMVSESQERMTLAVAPDQLASFMALARDRGVVATVLGEFEDKGFLRIFYKGEVVGHLDLQFLHHSLPPLKLTAQWKKPSREEREKTFTKNPPLGRPVVISEEKWGQGVFLKEALLKVLSSLNVCSKESLVRQYDHEVLAATHIKPFVGAKGEGPSDAAVIWLHPHGGEEKRGVALGHGLCPKLSRWDTYTMSQWAVDEAVRNVVATGGDPGKLCLVDNFCWPDPVLSAKNPDGPYKLAQLVRACKGLYDSCQIFGAPLVSGKDSMKNDFYGKDAQGRPVKISVLPTLLVTAMADIEDLSFTVTSDFKREGDMMYHLGTFRPGWGGSEFSSLFQWENSWESPPPQLDLQENAKLYRSLAEAIRKDMFQSIHDISDGGLLTALVESMIGGDLGAQMEISFLKGNLCERDRWEFLFNESPGRFVVSLHPRDQKRFLEHFKAFHPQFLGVVGGDKGLRLVGNGFQDWQIRKHHPWEVSLEELKKSWRKL